MTKRINDDTSVPFRQCALRVTSKVKEKSSGNNLPILGMSMPVVIAINMPYPKAWLGSARQFLQRLF